VTDYSTFLRSMDIFRPLPDDELARIASRLKERRFSPGETIFHRGDPGDAMFIIVEGRVKVILSTDAQGQERVLAFLDQGDVVGEMALLTGNPRSSDVEAATDVTLLELRREEFEERIATHPLVLKQMLRLMADRQTTTNARLVQQEEAAGRGETGRGKVFAVYSSKGGSGRTMIAVNLAVALAQQFPDQVALLDLDLTFGHGTLLLDLQPRGALAALGVDVLADLDREAFNRYLSTHSSTLRMLPGAVRPEEGEGITQEHVQHIIRLLKRFFSYVVVDTGANFADTTLASLEASDRIVFVLTPELAMVRDGIECRRIFRDVLSIPDDRFYYLLNHPYGFRALSREEFERGFGRSAHAELPFGGDVPAQAAARGEPFVVSQSGTPIARAIEGLARELAGVGARGAAPSAGNGQVQQQPAKRGGGPLGFLRRGR
jgi:CRP-like cAMP-binding protein